MDLTLVSPSAAPSDRFTAIMDELCESVARLLGVKYNLNALIILIWSHFTKIQRRFAHIIARGPRPAPTRSIRPRPTPEPTQPPAEREPRPRYVLPSRHAWLLRELAGDLSGIEAAKSAFADLLSDPAMTDLIATHPGLDRLLRPLCHAFGIERPPSLEPPPRLQPDPKPRKKRRRRLNAAEFDALYAHPLPMEPGGSRFWPPWIKLR